MQLKGKVLLITGSSSGIGKEAALQFAQEQAKVIVTYCQDEEAGNAVARQCTDLGAEDVLVNKLDLLDSDSIKSLVSNVINRYGRIDIIVNNAGIGSDKNLQDHSFEEIERVIRIDLEGLIKITDACLPYLKHSIINIASRAGMIGYKNTTLYCAAKFGVRGFSQALGKELKDINVYCVNPELTATRMTNYRGVQPQKVAEVIINTAKGVYKVEPGGDINVWEHINQ